MFFMTHLEIYKKFVSPRKNWDEVSFIHLGDIKIIPLASTGEWQKLWDSNLYNTLENNPSFQILAMMGLFSYLMDMLPFESLKHLSKLFFLPNK